MDKTVAIDRLSIRRRPPGLPLMYQSWRKLLFMHWQVSPELLRPHVPVHLNIDTFDGKGWIGVTPFVIKGLRPVFVPELPGLGDFNEINVRTYVHLDGVPGVWFFSLDADSPLAVTGARTFFHLPYHDAEIDFREENEVISYHSKRKECSSAMAEFKASWKKGRIMGEAEPDSLEFFLVERYCLYSTDGMDLYRSRIFHQPWKLQSAELSAYRSTMIESQGLPKPTGAPLLHYSEFQDVSVWPLKKVTKQTS